MLAGMYCLLLTSLGLWSFTVFRKLSPSAAYVLAMGVLLLVMNLAYVAAVVWQIVKIVDWRDVWQRVARACKAAAACAAGVACAKALAHKQESCTTAVDCGSQSSRP